MSLIGWVRRAAPAPQVEMSLLPRQRSPLDDPNPWVRIAYHEGIDWARQQREMWARSPGWRPPVNDWARWCESYYLNVVQNLGWTPDPGGSAHLTWQQKDAGDGASIGLALATEQLYPRGHASPDALTVAAKHLNPPHPAGRTPRHGPHPDRP